MLEQELRRDFLEVCHLVQNRGLVKGAGGNVSFRLPGGGMLVSPSGRSLAALQEDDVITVAQDGSWRGRGKPSREWPMHHCCYARDDVQVVIHVHSVYAVAISCLRGLDVHRAMPAYTPGYALYVGALPVLPYWPPGSQALANAVGGAMASRDSVLLANHGVVAAGPTAEQALNLLEEIEENAHLHFLLKGRGQALSDAQVAELESCYS